MADTAQRGRSDAGRGGRSDVARTQSSGTPARAGLGLRGGVRPADRRRRPRATPGEIEADPDTADYARRLVAAVVDDRADIDALIERTAPQYPVVQLARMDRALLRCAIGEVLHSATTPARVAIAEWVDLARTYSGDPARRLVNGVLGRIASDRPGA